MCFLKNRNINILSLKDKSLWKRKINILTLKELMEKKNN